MRKFNPFFIICFLFPLSLYAKTWSLAELSILALEQHPQTREAWAQVEMASANIGIAKATYWPQVSLNLTSGLNSDNTNDSEGIGCNNNDPYCFNLSLNQLLWDFGNRSHQVEQAKYQQLSALWNANQALQTVVYGVESAYYQRLGQQALVRADALSLKEAKVNWDSAKALHEQGLATIGDVYQAQSTWSQAELTLETDEGTLDSLKGNLAVAVGLPINTFLEIVDLPKHFAIDKAIPALPNLLRQAEQERPEAKVAEANLKASKANQSALEASRWPSLALSLNTARANTWVGGTTLNRQSNAQLTLTLPVFTGFQQSQQIEQAKSEVKATEANLELTQQQVDLSVWQAYYALNTAKAAISTAQSYLKSSEIAAKQALGQYQAGVGNILTVLTTQSTEANARVQMIQSVLNAYLALAALMQSLGETPLYQASQGFSHVVPTP